MIEQKSTRRRVKIKRARSHAAHHGGSWKVAYADFVTAMMALFLVLWLVSQGDQRLKASLANYFRNPGAFDTTAGNIINDAASTDGKINTVNATVDDEKAFYGTTALLRKRLSGADSNQIKINITAQGLHIQILDSAEKVSFTSGSAELSPATREILKDIATSICELPNEIEIGGHTDSYTYANMGYTNWELSADRANAARRELEADCVKPERIRRIVGFADTKPLDANDLYAPANRRISIMILRQKTLAVNLVPGIKVDPDTISEPDTKSEPDIKSDPGAKSVPGISQRPAQKASLSNKPIK
jgi:chemotaxis protein MotB